MLSAYPSFHCRAISTATPSRSPPISMGFVGSVSLLRFRCSTNELIPPSYWKRCFLLSRSSSSRMRMPRFRKESSRSRCERVSKLKVVVSKIWGSGLNVTLVPRRSVLPVCSSRVCGSPRAYD